MMLYHTLPRLLLLSALALGPAACTTDAPATTGGRSGPTEVGVVTVEAEPVTLTAQLPGRTAAFRVAEVRARVDGIVHERLFEEGSAVEEGQPLFRIDPALYRAALDSARAELERAKAARDSAKLLADRYAGLVDKKAVSRQQYDDALAELKTAEANVAAARAAVDTARIELEFTTVTAPVSGRIGRAEVTEGAYVQRSAATLLATIQQLDPMYVDVTWSTAEALRFRRMLAERPKARPNGEVEVELLLADDRLYEGTGTLQFADVTVDPSTGQVALRAIFPNPDTELLPGMFVRARVEERTVPRAILVPQRGATRDDQGRATALVVNEDDQVERRQLVTDRAVGDAWLVTDGIGDGDRVIVEGVQKVRPGDSVSPVEAESETRARR